MSTATRIEVIACPTGPPGVRTRLVAGDLSPRRLRSAGAPDSTVRVALVAARALLLAGDAVRTEVLVEGPVQLDLIETAGTVAYDMRGGSARWDVSVVLRDGASLTWAGEPFVVASGASVDRSLSLDLSGGARAAVRESLVLGRTGEVGGDLRTRTRASVDDQPLLVEDLDLARDTREGWAVLGAARCLETVTTYGVRLPESAGTLQSDRPASTVRTFGERHHLSRSEQAWADAVAAMAFGRSTSPTLGGCASPSSPTPTHPASGRAAHPPWPLRSKAPT
ncbi:MAG: urease accessory protein UreD [Marmoricola sp.]